MCGRIGVVPDEGWLKSIQSVLKINAQDWHPLPPSWNIAPTQSVSVLRHLPSKPINYQPLVWGLVPPWAKDPSIGQHCINARSETASQKPAFKHAWHKQRCLVPVTAWYEWREENSRKQPYLFRYETEEPAMVAGLWESWTDPRGEVLESFALLTCEAEGKAAEVHHRMPVLLAPKEWALWLGPDGPDAVFQKLMVPSQKALTIYPVDRRVNKAGEDGPELFLPLVEKPEGEDGQQKAKGKSPKKLPPSLPLFGDL